MSEGRSIGSFSVRGRICGIAAAATVLVADSAEEVTVSSTGHEIAPTQVHSTGAIEAATEQGGLAQGLSAGRTGVSTTTPPP